MNPPENDPLRKVLGQWKVADPLPPRFQEQVWRRIAKRESPEATAWELWQRWLESLFAKRTAALAYVTVLLGVGLTAGYVSGHTHEQREKAQLAARYVRSIDPYYNSQ